MNIPTGLILEGLVALLLVTTIAYCWVLDRKLKAIREGQDGMRDLVKALNRTSELARHYVSDMNEASRRAGQELEERIQSAKELGEDLRQSIEGGQANARALADELSIMVDAGNNLAERLETQVNKRVAAKPAAPSPMPAHAQRIARAPVPQTAAKAPAPAPQQRAQAGRAGGEPADVPALQQKLMDALRRSR